MNAIWAQSKDDISRYHWDLSSLYSDNAAWEAERATIEKKLATIGRLNGALGRNAQSLAGAMDEIVDLRHRAGRMGLYGHLRFDADPRSEDARAKYALGNALETKVEVAVSFAADEIRAIGATLLKQIGVDMATPETYQAVFHRLNRLIGKLEKLFEDQATDPLNLTQHKSSDAEPMWSPDGKKIAFYSDRNASPQARFRIYLMNADGSNQTELPGSRADFRPAWSPNGKQIAFDSFRDGNHEIYIVNADGSNLKRLTNDPAYDSSPRWSPDGKKIVYFSGPDWKPGANNYGASDVWLMNVDGSGKTRLTMSEGDDTYPSFSSDGRRIVFTSWRDGNAEIYVMNADGSNQTRLTNHPARDDNARWAPDGKKIGFGSNRDGDYEVYLMNADGTEQTNLTRHPSVDVDPSWSPDGRKIAFVSNRDGNYEIYVMQMPEKR